MVTGATNPLHRQSSNNTAKTHNENLIAEPLNTQQDPVNQTVLGIEKLPKNTTIVFSPENTLIFNGKLEKTEKFEYFEDLFHTTLKMELTLNEETKIISTHTCADWQTSENIQRSPTTTLEEHYPGVPQEKR